MWLQNVKQKWMNSKKREIDKALKRLCEVGLIEKHHQYTPNGGYKSNIYTIPDFGDIGSP